MAVPMQIEAGFEDFARLVVRFRWLAIALLLALSVALGLQLPKLRVDNSDEAFLRADDRVCLLDLLDTSRPRYAPTA